MEALAKLARWFGLGVIAVAALAAAYTLGRTSAESGERHQRHQDAARKDDPELRSALRAAQERLARCQENLQRHDEHVQKREEEPETNEVNPTSSPEPARPNQCTTALQVNELHILAANCRSFRRHFDAYRAILGSSTIDCEIVLDIFGVAEVQSAFCALIIRSSEATVYRDAMSDPLAIAALEDAYATRNEYGGPDDINKLVTNPACRAQMRAK